MNPTRNLLLGLALIGIGGAVMPGHSAHAQMDPSLTPFGAEKAGTPDGVIPPYTGGIKAMTGLPSASPASGYPDPFASEKPVFSVTSANMSQYANELTPGEQALLQRYAGYRIDVYPTHRTFSYPDWVLQNTAKNMTAAQPVANGDGVSNAFGGIPFPVPKDGYQVMWNSFLQYQPAFCKERFQNYLVDTNGGVTSLGTLDTTWAEPYYNPVAQAMNGAFWRYYTVRYLTPAAEAGQLYMFQYPINFTQSDDVTYFYSPGTRRVRLAPEFKYDTPISSYGGAIDYDEIDLFYGRMDKFDWKLVGKKVMIVPYNDYKFANTTESDLLGPHFLKPDGVRWERHRVWVVDATLKDGKRHAYSRWTFYVDEDSWHVLASESYDHSGAIYRVGFGYPYQNYGQPDVVSFAHTFGIYDMSKGNYEISYVNALPDVIQYQCKADLPNMSNYTPQSMAAQAIR